jgi:hypothetical protein
MAVRELTPEHKEQMAQGRTEGRAVKSYLDALEDQRSARGSRELAGSIEKKIASIDQQLPKASSIKRLQMSQDRRNLETKLLRISQTADFDSLEANFIKVGAKYASRKGIEYATWRAAGVPAAILERAGIKR